LAPAAFPLGAQGSAPSLAPAKSARSLAKENVKPRKDEWLHQAMLQADSAVTQCCVQYQ